jgi:uroporphyrin-III C-methyltransferase / precorrin-2 dehydrogenase / sirohydrochlorin ferrochelatase
MAAEREASVYPLFVKLEGRRVLVVGGGAVAQRKVEALLASKARVCVVSPEATEGLRRLADEARVDWTARAFVESDVEAAWIVVAATSDLDVQNRVAAAAEARRVFVVAVDHPEHASAYAGAVVERPPFVVAISSGGATPALTRLVRELIEDILPPADWVEQAKQLRATWKAEGTPFGDRFGDLVKRFAAKRFPGQSH